MLGQPGRPEQMARRTGFREQYYTGTRKYFSVGKIGASDQVTLCIRFGLFFIDIFWNLYSFWLGLFVELELCHIYIMEAVGSLGKSIRNIMSGAK